jgi:hypothetical protein
MRWLQSAGVRGCSSMAAGQRVLAAYPAAIDDDWSCGHAFQVVSRAAVNSSAGRGQSPPGSANAPQRNVCHNPVTGLPAPLRVLCRLTRGNRQSCHLAGDRRVAAGQSRIGVSCWTPDIPFSLAATEDRPLAGRLWYRPLTSILGDEADSAVAQHPGCVPTHSRWQTACSRLVSR